jgi:hypothetical protein
MGGLFAAGLACYLVYGPSSGNASNTGFSLNQACTFLSTPKKYFTNNPISGLQFHDPVVGKSVE